MGFLSGVLKAVKNENEVTTYDNYISGENNKLESVLNTLNTNIGSGRAGLAVSVDAVKRWLEGYGKNLRTSTYLVTHELDGLKEFISGKHIYGIHDVQNLQDQLKTWTEVVKKIDEHVKQNIISNVDKLDYTLKRSVMNKIDPLRASINQLLDSAKDPAVIQQVKKVDTELQAQELKIKDSLGNEVYKLRDSLKLMKDTKNRQIWYLRKSVNDFMKMIEDNHFNNTYKDNIISQFNDIKRKVNDVYDTLFAKQAQLKGLVEQAQQHFAIITNTIGMDAKIGHEKSIYRNWDKLRETISNLVLRQIYGQNKHEGLRGILSGVGNYADGFKWQTFEKIMQQLLQEIVEKDSVYTNIDAYVRYNKNNFTGDLGVGEKTEAILKKLTPIIIQKAKDAIKTIKPSRTLGTRGSVDGEISEIIKYLGKLTSDVENMESNITQAIEEELASGSELSYVNAHQSDHKHYLSSAIKETLSIISMSVKYVCAQLENFKNASRISNLDQAIKDVTAIPGKLSDDPSLGQNITNGLKTVTNHIEELNKFLVKSTGDNSMHEAIDELKSKMVDELDKLKKDKEGHQGQNGIINENKDKADEQMEKLKTELKKKLNSFDINVTHADTLIEDSIDSIVRVLDDAHGVIERTVTDAFEKVRQSVRALFAESHRADLSALRSLVDQQLKAVQGIIAKDRVTGVKGMLKTLSGVSVNMKSSQYADQNNMLMKLQTAASKKNSLTKAYFDELVQLVRAYYRSYLIYVHDDAVRLSASHPSPSTDYPSQLKAIFDKLVELLNHLEKDKLYNYDHNFVDLLASLNSLVDSLSPSFTSPCPLLAPLKAGLAKFTEQLGHAYVSRYSGQKYTALTERKQVPDPKKPDSKEKIDVTDLTPEGRNCAKVCLTIVEMLTKNFVELKDECQVYKSKQINTYDDNLFGECFTKRGFTVTSDKGRQHGELQDKSDMTGDAVYKKITAKVTGVQMLTFLKTWKEEQRRKHPHRHPNGNIHLFDVLDFLQGYVVTYYTVRHLEHIPSAKAPRNIYQMLQWLSGVRYYPSLIPLFLCFKDLFPRRKEDEGKDIKAISPASVKLSATTEITYAHLGRKVFVNVCLHAHDVLVAILGHGHAGGRYAVDFKTNEAKLLYPSKASDCFDMLVDIAYRVQHQLYFLFQQFYFESSYSSWRDCLYGRGVAGSSWKCNTKQCPNHDCNQTARQTANQMGNQTCDQHCDQYPMCDLKSPLQSFLEDGLQGFLPHQFTKPGCKLECTAANHKAIPCKTPMGFGDISNMASHTQKGTHLRDVLIDFCGNSTAPLTLMCAYFNCLLQRPPQNLGDMFAFYYNLMKEWSKNETHKRKAFDEAVRKANFENRGTTLELDDVFSAHSNISSNHAGRHLSSLVNCDGDSGSNCGRYLKPISTDVYTIYSSEYADKYVSWIVYLTETFYDLLKKLYDECNGNCGPKGSNCHNKCCVKGCPSLVKESKNVTHDEGCTSIVQCKHTLPTLCRYGFTFWYQTRINGEQGIEKKRTCKDLCNVLERVLSDKEADQAPLAKLIYVTIPNFLFEIRAPFIWLNVALWLLSLLYLLHIMVIRLDLLHIKSHLHSPSSHRIAAQSLLSAARVNKLNRVFYLQP
ncbi:hypothetical protein, conserved [Babesia bigemina]|uniref:C3H1-type domain-containing protein n=1 Tax=Babesia bigemina TaxID=5866 RepID=A0A061BQK2_BABBI|nr:hypothetical protein, conserved [Babesia bigemina]CDR71753.1 hypothetical protein, conserved [Babesia bigemina]|eukprot:XP_012770698.1 hypothetical protein, conserved [Babesia bigemina]